MHKPLCDSRLPTLAYPSAAHSCVRPYDHEGDHVGCTGISWAQPELVSAEDLEKCLQAYKDNPKGFKNGHTR